MTEKTVSEYEFSNRFLHWSLVALICVAGIATSIGVNRKLFEQNTENIPYRISLGEVEDDVEHYAIPFSLQNESDGTISQTLFDFDLYIDDVHSAEGRLNSDVSPQSRSGGRFLVPKSSFEPGSHVLTLISRMDRPLTRPVHYVANRKWEVSP